MNTIEQGLWEPWGREPGATAEQARGNFAVPARGEFGRLLHGWKHHPPFYPVADALLPGVHRNTDRRLTLSVHLAITHALAAP